MSQFPQMIYQVGDQEEMHGGRYNYMLVDDASALEAMLGAGWYLTPAAAKEATEAPSPAAVEPVLTEPETSLLERGSLEARATELGIKFDGRTSDRKLNNLIIEKLGQP